MLHIWGEDVFSGCNNLTSVKLSDNLKEIKDYSFFRDAINYKILIFLMQLQILEKVHFLIVLAKKSEYI